jgi:hypothetical protein
LKLHHRLLVFTLTATIAMAANVVAATVDSSGTSRGGTSGQQSVTPPTFTLELPSLARGGHAVAAPVSLPAFNAPSLGGGGAGAIAGIPSITAPSGAGPTPIGGAGLGSVPNSPAAFREMFRIRTQTPVIPAPASATLASLVIAALALRRSPR